MADFTLQEVRQFLNEISNEYGITKVYSYMNAVETSLTEYNSIEQKQTIVIPEKYRSNVMEYYILLHFMHFYLEGLMHSKSIVKSFSKIEGVKHVSIVKGTKEVLKEEVSFDRSKKLESDFETLKILFVEIGRALIGERFSFDDFINYK